MAWRYLYGAGTGAHQSDSRGNFTAAASHGLRITPLEQRLGLPASKGCVRIAAALNRFLDLRGVLDADYAWAACHDLGYPELLLPERGPTMLAGDVLVILDFLGSLIHIKVKSLAPRLDFAKQSGDPCTR